MPFLYFQHQEFPKTIKKYLETFLSCLSKLEDPEQNQEGDFKVEHRHPFDIQMQIIKNYINKNLKLTPQLHSFILWKL